MIRLRRLHVAGLACVAAACAAGEGRVSSVLTLIDSSGGFPIHRHSGTPAEWRAELVTTVGADSGAPYEFGQVRSIVLDHRGRLHVLDPTTVQVSVFDSTGTFVGVRGRRGGGPGEFTSPFSLAMLHDSLVVFAPYAARIVLFSPEGEWVRNWPTPAPTGAMGLLAYRTPPDGFWTHTAFLSGAAIRSVYVRHDSRGAVDTIAERRPYVASAPPITCPVANGGFTWYPVPFGPTGFSRPVGDGAQVSVVSSEYRLAFFGRSPDTVRVVERDVAPAPITDAEWASEAAKFRQWRATRGNPTCTRTEFDRPPARPIVEWMFVDDERQLWVESYSPKGAVYEVFGLDGALLATVTGLPPSRRVDPSVAAGRIALYAPDTNDVPRVQVYRIRKP